MRGPLLTTNIVGGLGNQLFLVANLISVASRHRDRQLTAVIPRVSSSDSCGPPRPVYWNSVFQRLEESVAIVAALPGGWQTVVVPESRPVTPVVLDSSYATTNRDDIIYSLTGFFQSHLYFERGSHKEAVDGGDTLLGLLPHHYRRGALQHLHNNYLPEGAAEEACHTVGVHVRRGDYLTMRHVFPILEFDYFDAALSTLLGPALYKAPFQVDPPPAGTPAASTTADVIFPSANRAAAQTVRVLIFSEDAAYARMMAGAWMVKYPGIFATHVDPSKENRSPVAQSFSEGDVPPRDVLELLMMASCDDVVIANSSFSWWAAYWNRRPGRRVVAPTKWFVAQPFPTSAHLYPDGWILL